MSDNQVAIHDRLVDIHESIDLIQEWSKGRATVNDGRISDHTLACYLWIT